MKLYRFPHSPYARKIEMQLALMGVSPELVDVPYCDRSELVRLTGGYLHVPVLVDDDGTVVTESKRIAERLLSRDPAAALVPSPWDGPIWAYCDWVDGPLEDVLFRLSTPKVRDHFGPVERALFVLIKERKFGPGCVDAWAVARGELVERGRALLAPSARTLAAQPFLFGARPTLADCALYGQFAMLSVDESLPPSTFGGAFPEWLERLSAATREARRPA
jgi:glutathione S-transferase